MFSRETYPSPPPINYVKRFERLRRPRDGGVGADEVGDRRPAMVVTVVTTCRRQICHRSGTGRPLNTSAAAAAFPSLAPGGRNDELRPPPPSPLPSPPPPSSPATVTAVCSGGGGGETLRAVASYGGGGGAPLRPSSRRRPGGCASGRERVSRGRRPGY